MSLDRGRPKRQSFLPQYLKDFDTTMVRHRAHPTETEQDGPDEIVAQPTPVRGPRQGSRPKDPLRPVHEASLSTAFEDLRLENLKLKAQQSDHKLELLQRKSASQSQELRAEIKELSKLVKQLQPRSTGQSHGRSRRCTPSPRRSKRYSSSPSPPSSPSSHHTRSPSPEMSQEQQKSKSELPKFALSTSRHAYGSWSDSRRQHSPTRRYSKERRPARSPEYSRAPERQRSRQATSYQSPERRATHSRSYHPERRYATSPEPRQDWYRSESPPARRHSRRHTASPFGGQERSYRGPIPTIPDFSHPNPREFARLRIALENLLPRDTTERFKYQVLCDHLKLEEALLVADSYINSPYPYSDTMEALNEQFGQPHQLALQRIAELIEAPSVASGDTRPSGHLP